MSFIPAARVRRFGVRSFVLLLTVALFLPGALAAVGEGDALDLAEAGERLDRASDRIRDRRATGDELRAAVEDVAAVHAGVSAAEPAAQDLRRDAEGLLLRALVLSKSERRNDEENLRADVNTLAAVQLGALSGVLDAKARRSLSLRIRTAVERTLLARWEPEHWHQPHLDATFAALAALNTPDTLAWIVEEFHHTKDRELPFLIAAHKALPAFTDVPGALRRDLCDTLITAYAGVELVANKASNVPADLAKKRFWDQMGVHTVPAVQALAGQPRDATGRALSTLAEFQAWWREHRDARAAPWQDA